MQARLVRPSALTDADIEAWRRFQSACASLASPFFSPEFSQAVGEARRDAWVAVLNDGSDPRAFLPHHRLRLGVGRPIGGSICDYQGVIHAPGQGVDPTVLLRAARLSAFDFNHAPASQESLAPGAFASSLSPVMDLTGGVDGVAERLASQGSRALKDLGRKRRKLEREMGALRFVADDTSPEAWDALLRFKRSASEAKGNRSALDMPWVSRTVSALRERQNRFCRAPLSVLWLEDRPVALHFGLRTDRVWSWWFPTYDPALGRFSPGLILLMEMAAEAERLGVGAIDFGRGDQRYKRSFATRSIPLLEGSIARRGTPAAALRHAHRMALHASEALPPGRLRTLPKRLARKVTGVGVHLPAEV